MPLSKQETHCIELACEYLSSKFGGSWTVESLLDELYDEEPTPEVIVSNEKNTAAIEVKRLTGDSVSQDYIKYHQYCQSHLVPSCGGYYTLTPHIDFHLPMDVKLLKHVKREIERVAPTLSAEQSGAIKIMRSGHISLACKSGSPMIYCLHGGPLSELLSPIQEQISGRFMLVDEGWEHSFVTQECRLAFQNAVVEACKKRLDGDATPFNWYEEWELERLPGGSNGEDDAGVVQIWTCTPARDVRESVAECIYMVLTNALRKFKKRWADYHVLVLERLTYAPDQFMSEAIEALEADEIRDLDYILLIDSDDTIQCYPSLRST